MNSKHALISIFMISTVIFSPIAFADGARGDSNEAAPIGTPGSDASFDNRLPPVFPGERVTDSGKEIRVWSSSGPVPVSPPPQAPQPFEQSPQQGGIPLNDAQLGGVIVDTREGDRRR